MQTNRFFPLFSVSFPLSWFSWNKESKWITECFSGCGCVCGRIFLNHVTSLCDLLFLPRETSVTPFLIFVMHHQPQEKKTILSSLGYCTLESNNLMYTRAGVIKVPVELQGDSRYTSVCLWIPTGAHTQSHHLRQHKYAHTRAQHKLTRSQSQWLVLLLFHLCSQQEVGKRK